MTGIARKNENSVRRCATVRPPVAHDGGAGARHAGEQRQRLGEADSEGGARVDAVDVATRARSGRRSITRISTPPTISAQATVTVEQMGLDLLVEQQADDGRRQERNQQVACQAEFARLTEVQHQDGKPPAVVKTRRRGWRRAGSRFRRSRHCGR